MMEILGPSQKTSSFLDFKHEVVATSPEARKACLGRAS